MQSLPAIGDLLQINAASPAAAENGRMERAQPVTQVDSATARCTGSGASPHEPIDLALANRGPVVCPRCGRRFVRAGPSGSVSPAIWPKDD